MPPNPPPSVKIVGMEYMVTGLPGDHVHMVNKSKECHCGSDCKAVATVATYLKAGGQRAPDILPEPISPSGRFVIPAVCPICNSTVTRVDGMWHAKHGAGWRCDSYGIAHLWQHRYAHLEEWYTCEGAKRHHMFISRVGDPS